MGARSSEALERRAAKRGRSLEEQKKADREADRRKEQKSEQATERQAKKADEATPGNAEAGVGAKKTFGVEVWRMRGGLEARNLKRDEKAGWFCTATSATGGQCGFINFAHRVECKSCGRARHEPPNAIAKSAGQARAVKAAVKAARPADQPPGLGAWEGSLASKERIAENQKLRQRLM